MTEDQKTKDLHTAKDDDLHVDWIRRYDVKRKCAIGPKIYVAVCKCGSKKLLKAELGIRCMDCSAFHSFDSFKKVIETAKRLSFGAGHVGGTVEERIVQVVEDKNYRAKLYDKMVKLGIIKKKIIV